MGAKLVAVAACCAAWLARRFTLPAPDEDLGWPLPLGRDVLALAAGGARGPAVPAALEGPYALNAKLRNATRLFEGRVLGSESVAVQEDGVLVMLDKFGYVRRAAPDPAGGGLAYAMIDEVPGRAAATHCFARPSRPTPARRGRPSHRSGTSAPGGRWGSTSPAAP